MEVPSVGAGPSSRAQELVSQGTSLSFLSSQDEAGFASTHSGTNSKSSRPSSACDIVCANPLQQDGVPRWIALSPCKNNRKLIQTAVIRGTRLVFSRPQRALRAFLTKCNKSFRDPPVYGGNTPSRQSQGPDHLIFPKFPFLFGNFQNLAFTTCPRPLWTFY